MAESLADVLRFFGWLLSVLLLNGIGLIMAVSFCVGNTSFALWDSLMERTGRKSAAEYGTEYSLGFKDSATWSPINLRVLHVLNSEGPDVSEKSRARLVLGMSGIYDEQRLDLETGELHWDRRLPGKITYNPGDIPTRIELPQGVQCWLLMIELGQVKDWGKYRENDRDKWYDPEVENASDSGLEPGDVAEPDDAPEPDDVPDDAPEPAGEPRPEDAQRADGEGPETSKSRFSAWYLGGKPDPCKQD